MNKKDLFILAKEAMKNSNAPYSNYNVGAVLLTKNGNIYKGCNVENASYSVTCCAERTALFSAVASGEKEFESICIVGGKNSDITDYAMPCGICRQALAEFCDADFKVYVGISENDIKEFTLGELLPYSFNKSKLGD
ncbi:MAG: cytidine deaminase [Clostridia bacterium]|nr:cytidine deaminase [Clostridia bacterium]